MKSGWETKQLGEVCEIINGSTPLKSKKEYWENGTVPWFTIEDIREQGRIIRTTKQKITEFALNDTSVKLLPQETVLLCCTASVGEFAITEIPLTTNQQFNGLIVNDVKNIYPKFIYYQAATLKSKLMSISGKTTIDFIPKSRLKNILISVPPLPEQHRIVAILDEAFADIAAAKEKAEYNLKNAKEVFESCLKEVFINNKGWFQSNIGEICVLKSGTTMPHDLEKESGDIPYLKVADMNFEENMGNITMSSRFLDKKDIKDSMIIPKGAVIFPKRGGAILTNKKRMTSIPICADLNIMAVIPTEKIESKLLYYYFLNVDMKKIGTGSSIPQINNYDISPLSIAYPRDLSKQKEIVSFLDELSDETSNLESLYQQKLSDLEELKKSVLQQAFSGAL